MVRAVEDVVVLRGVRAVARDDAVHVEHGLGRLLLLRRRDVLEPGRNVAVLIGEGEVPVLPAQRVDEALYLIARILVPLVRVLPPVPVAVRPDARGGRGRRGRPGRVAALRVRHARREEAVEWAARLRRVVGRDDDEGLVQSPLVLQGLDDLAHLLVGRLRDERQVPHLLYGARCGVPLASVLGSPHVAELVDAAEADHDAAPVRMILDHLGRRIGRPDVAAEVRGVEAGHEAVAIERVDVGRRDRAGAVRARALRRPPAVVASAGDSVQGREQDRPIAALRLSPLVVDRGTGWGGVGAGAPAAANLKDDVLGVLRTSRVGRHRAGVAACAR